MSLVRTFVLRYNGIHIQKFLSSLKHRQIHTYTNRKIVIYMTFQKQLTLWYISHIIKGDYMTKFKLIAYEKEILIAKNRRKDFIDNMK